VVREKKDKGRSKREGRQTKDSVQTEHLCLGPSKLWIFLGRKDSRGKGESSGETQKRHKKFPAQTVLETGRITESGQL